MGLVVWIIAVLIFVLALVAFGGFGFFDAKYGAAAERNLIRPFAAMQGTSVTRRDGTSQISCPAGTKVSIIGAVYEVFDPSGQCTDKPFDPKQSPNAVCGAPLVRDRQGAELSAVRGSGQCRLRDVTAQVAMKCNGTDSCDLTVDSAALGPYPCPGIAPGDAAYGNLPTDTENGEPTIQGYILHGSYTCE